ncbi:MAG TPA: pyruvate dehydrogenase (acetyl-transferring), homodimeric type, partial [Burkholderiaceae bacterium]|nr:pyruvate dehydrogenase (acetyl-transferring), homodimeric type [Burkholderiaceae bacterium]
VRDEQIGQRIVPIIPDEARTFGMDPLFKEVGIYNPLGQRYTPVDKELLLSYIEKQDGQLLEEGITEAGALSSWAAAATSYSVHGVPMLPFYIYYSMFGFQRVGDLIWAAADQRARGFLIGATAGRTTLGGEGLQHQDGSSQLVAATVPNCRAYDPAFACELAVIVEHGARRMLEAGDDAFYYVTVMNENYPQPSLRPGTEADIVRGMYRFGGRDTRSQRARVRLLGSGALLREAIAAADLLADDWDVATEIWSVTSFSELARDARDAERWNRLNPRQRRNSHLERCLGSRLPTVAVTDYVRAYPQLIAPYVAGPYVVLGTDGFGRSDTRAALRRFFEVDRHHVVLAALQALERMQAVPADALARAIERYAIDVPALPPWDR